MSRAKSLTIVVLLALPIGACAAVAEPPSPAASDEVALRRSGESIIVFQAGADFSGDLPNAPWRVVADAPPEGGFALSDLGGRGALRVDASRGALLVRPVHVSLATAPKLRWAWYLEPSHFGGGAGLGLDRGLRVEIGISDGAPSSWFPTGDFPAHARRVDIALAGVGAPNAALASHSLYAVSDKGVRRTLAAATGDAAGRWRVEEVDLAALHRALWPSVKVDGATIEYIAIGGMPGALPPGVPPTVGYISEILLAR